MELALLFVCLAGFATLAFISLCALLLMKQVLRVPQETGGDAGVYDPEKDRAEEDFLDVITEEDFIAGLR